MVKSYYRCLIIYYSVLCRVFVVYDKVSDEHAVTLLRYSSCYSKLQGQTK